MVTFNDYMNKHGGQVKRLTAVVPQTDVSVSGAQTSNWKHAMTQQAAGVLVNSDPQASKIGQDNLESKQTDVARRKRGMVMLRRYFAEHKWLLIVDRIDAVIEDSFGAEALADRVGGQAEHVDLDVRGDALVREKLAGYHLKRAELHYNGERSGR